jgi:hypothetical protein
MDPPAKANFKARNLILDYALGAANLHPECSNHPNETLDGTGDRDSH